MTVRRGLLPEVNLEYTLDWGSDPRERLLLLLSLVPEGVEWFGVLVVVCHCR